MFHFNYFLSYVTTVIQIFWRIFSFVIHYSNKIFFSVYSWTISSLMRHCPTIVIIVYFWKNSHLKDVSHSPNLIPFIFVKTINLYLPSLICLLGSFLASLTFLHLIYNFSFLLLTQLGTNLNNLAFSLCKLVNLLNRHLTKNHNYRSLSKQLYCKSL